MLYGDDRGRLEAAGRAALDEAHRLDRLLSNYQPSSEWSAVNREAARRPMPVSAELFDLLAACLDYSRRSEGAFDITVGPLMKVWGFYQGDGTLASASDVRAALRLVGSRHVQLDPAARTVRFDEAGVEIDPGGIGKGYAVDRMVEVLKRRGVEVALVSAGGSSIYGLGAPPGHPGRLADADPRSREPPADRRGGVSEEHVALDVGRLREVLSRERADLFAYHGPADGIPSARRRGRVGRRAVDDRQRGLGQAVRDQRPRVDGDAPSASFRVLFCEGGSRQGCTWMMPR